MAQFVQHAEGTSSVAPNEFSLVEAPVEDEKVTSTRVRRKGSRAAISSTWLVGIAVVNFDVKVGQKVSALIPEDSCDDEIKKRIALLSLPDSYSGNSGDMLFSFRVRTNKLKYTQSTDRTFLYGHAYFARQKDSSAARGFHQSAVVYLTTLPYAALFRTLADVTGPLYFELGKSVLKTIVCDIAKWQEPKPGTKMTLPVSGMLLSYRVPLLFSGECGDRVSDGAKASEARELDEARKPNGNVKARKKLVYPNKLERSASEESSTREKSITKFSSNKANLSIDTLGTATKSHINRSASLPLDSLSPSNSSSPAIKTIYDVFDVSAQEHAGFFQSVGLFSTFGTALAPSLWQAWELLMCGESIMIYAPSPDLCSRAVFALISTIAPLPFAGDFRPYFTIYDTDFNVFAESLGSGGRPTPGAPLPPVILGVTNPFFLKSFDRFPNIISLGQGEHNVHSHAKWVKPVVWNRGKVLKKMTEVNCPPCFLVGRAPSLPSNTQVLRQLLPVRNKSHQNSDGKTINPKQLNRSRSISGKIRCVFERRDDAIATSSDGKVGVDACAEDAINNALFRQHFRALTQTFLQPFDRYFGIDFNANNTTNASASSGLVGGVNGSVDADLTLVGFGPYSIDCLNLPTFDKKIFLKYLKQSGMPNAFKTVGMKSKFLRLYEKFVDTVHFKKWFADKQASHRADLCRTMESMRLEIKAKELLCSIAPTLYNMVKGKLTGKKSVPKREIDGLAHVLIKIKNEIENESKAESLRMRLIKKMIEHYVAVKKLLPQRFLPAECSNYSPSMDKAPTSLQEPNKKEDIAECV